MCAYAPPPPHVPTHPTPPHTTPPHPAHKRITQQQGVESARREYYREVELAQGANLTKYQVAGVTDSPLFSKQYVFPQGPAQFFNKWYVNDDPAVSGNWCWLPA